MLTWITALMVAAAVDKEPNPSVMRGNLTALATLQPYLMSPARFRDPANADVIIGSLELLARRPPPSTHLAVPTSAAVLQLQLRQVDQARADFEAGRAEAARQRLRAVPGLCAGCHAKAPLIDMPAVSLTPARLPQAPTERAQLLAGIGQFDAALAIWTGMLSADPRTEAEAHAQALALPAALNVAVRVKDDPEVALRLLRLALRHGRLTGEQRRDALQWVRQASAWRDERFHALPEEPHGLVERARTLLASSTASSWPGPEQRQLIAVLRARSYLDIALARVPDAPWRGEALYLLALATGASAEPDLVQVDCLLLEQCVTENPHSALAEKCVERLGDRVVWLRQVGQDTSRRVALELDLTELRSLASLAVR